MKLTCDLLSFQLPTADAAALTLYFPSTRKNNAVRKFGNMDELAFSLKPELFTGIQLQLKLPITVWVATVEVEISALTENVNNSYRDECC